MSEKSGFQETPREIPTTLSLPDRIDAKDDPIRLVDTSLHSTEGQEAISSLVSGIDSGKFVPGQRAPEDYAQYRGSVEAAAYSPEATQKDIKTAINLNIVEAAATKQWMDKTYRSGVETQTTAVYHGERQLDGVLSQSS